MSQLIHKFLIKHREKYRWRNIRIHSEAHRGGEWTGKSKEVRWFLYHICSF